MHVTQLNIYSRKVPKFDASVIVSSELGSAAILSWLIYPKLDQNPCGNALMVASVRAGPSPNGIATATQPITAEIAANVQMARCGVRFSECSMPKCSGTSSSLPIAYVTRAPVLMQDSVVPISARNTVTASINMKVRPCPARTPHPPR